MYIIYNIILRMCLWLFNSICVTLSITTDMGYGSICDLPPFCVVIGKAHINKSLDKKSQEKKILNKKNNNNNKLYIVFTNTLN